MTLQFVLYLFVNLNTHSIAHLECFSGYTNVKVCWSHSLQYNFVKARSPLFALNDQLKKKPWSLDEKAKVILCNFLPACLGMWPLDSWCSPTCYWITELYAEHWHSFFIFPWWYAIYFAQNRADCVYLRPVTMMHISGKFIHRWKITEIPWS